MAWDTDLIGKALAIASCPHSPLRVMAGPGTGKSFAMKRRVARLLEEGAEAKRILAVTFTRNAARSLLDDLHALGIDGCEDIRCGTLHGYCFSLLGKDDVFSFLGRIARPLLTFQTYGVLRFEAEPMLADLLKREDFGGKRKITKRIRAFEAAWARIQSDEPGWALEPVDEQLQSELTAWLTFHESILIGELIPEALRYLRANPGCDARSAFDHVVVDEYQDLNKAEQEVIQLLAENGEQSVVGDVDQSIYRFRHANPEGITDFATTKPGTHDETLDECRRCPQLVVELANHLIKKNHPPGVAPRLKPLKTNPDGNVYIVQWASLAEEAEGIADYVVWLIASGHSPNDILILSPRRLIGYAIRDAIDKKKISVHSFYNEEALESESAQEAFTLLALAAIPNDRVALRWWLGFGSPTWSANEYDRLRQHCETTGESPRDALERLVAGTLDLPRTSTIKDRYLELRTRLESLDGRTLEEIVDLLFPDGEEWAATIREAAILAIPLADDLADLNDKLNAAVTQPEVPENVDYVRVMSLHKSKGLTSKVAIVAGCIAGVIPFIDPDEPPAIRAEILREQRRLFYVAITRCTETLVLSSVKHIAPSVAYTLGASVRRDGLTAASLFMGELGPGQPKAVVGKGWVTDSYS
jgi:DNA helicase-2/ATP-dependent DNA helicase PcrA